MQVMVWGFGQRELEMPEPEAVAAIRALRSALHWLLELPEESGWRLLIHLCR